MGRERLILNRGDDRLASCEYYRMLRWKGVPQHGKSGGCRRGIALCPRTIWLNRPLAARCSPVLRALHRQRLRRKVRLSRIRRSPEGYTSVGRGAAASTCPDFLEQRIELFARMHTELVVNPAAVGAYGAVGYKQLAADLIG